MQARWGSHGGAQVIALAPSNVEECFYLTVRAVGLAERFRVPVIILSDASIGHMREKITLPESVEIVERTHPNVAPSQFMAFDTDLPDGVPQMADLGSEYISHITSFVHDKMGFPAWTDLEVTDTLIRRLNNKIILNKEEVISFEAFHLDRAKMIVVACGSVSRTAKAAVNMARESGVNVGLLKLLTIWPFPYDYIKKLSQTVNCVIVPELNLGQIAGEVRKACRSDCNVIGINRVDGALLTPEEIFSRIMEVR
jgi:2-oxoglutarate ferredoxin oxidoreductase subunit alpha